VALHIPEAGRLFGSQKLRVRSVDAWYLTEAERSPSRAALVLRRAAARASEGLAIVVRSDAQSGPTVRRLCPGAVVAPAAEEEILLDPQTEDAVHIQRLWRAVAQHLGALERRRARLSRAQLDGHAADEVRRPAVLADHIIAQVAPLVRELGARSAAAGELVLKRDAGNGRRDEVYVSRADLLARIAVLGGARRARFDPLELREGADDGERTQERNPFLDDSGGRRLATG
jgi:hypothetical protein